MSHFRWKHLRAGQVIRSGRATNTHCVEGVVKFLEAVLGDYDSNGESDFLQSPDPNKGPFRFYGGLIDNTGFSAVAYGDTMLSHGWDEFDYSGAGGERKDVGGQRPFAGTNPPSAISDVAFFPIGTSGEVRGLFVMGLTNPDPVPDVGDTNGWLWAEAEITGGPLEVAPGDTVSVTHTSEVYVEAP